MSLQQVVFSNRQRLRTSISFAVRDGLLDAWSRTGNNPREEDFVAALVFVSAPRIDRALKAILLPHGVNYSLMSVFCHKKPEVEFTTSKKSACELGDILFVHAHTGSGTTTYTSLLYQAKIGTSPHHLGAQDLDQLALYSWWPKFNYVRSLGFSGSRDVQPKASHPGAQYVLINNGVPVVRAGMWPYPKQSLVQSCMPDRILNGHGSMATELVEVLLAQSGRRILDRVSAASPSADEWSRVMWDLLGAALTKAFTLNSSGYRKKPRFEGDLGALDGLTFARLTSPLALSVASAALESVEKAERLYSSEDSPQRSKDASDDEPDSGVSAIILETRDSDSGEE